VTLNALAVMLVILWAMGRVMNNTMVGGYIHIVLIIAAVVLVYRALEGRETRRTRHA